MYHSLKQLAKNLLPRKQLFQHEETLRGAYAMFQKGSQFKCTVCHISLKQFVTLPNGEKLCPKCGSIGRNRRLWNLLNEEVLAPSIDLLHFSPSRCIYRRLKKRTDIQYTSTDFLDEFIADKKLDITAIEEPDNAFDVILCYHILEHIDDDIQAMQELFRVVKPNGFCLIQTPFKPGEIYEDPTLTSEQERLEHFGQEDHVRFYSVNGLKQRLESVGFKVEVKHFSESSENKHGFNTEEYILKACKP